MNTQREEEKVKFLLNRQRELEKERQTVEKEQQAIAEMIMPQLEWMLKPQSKGARLMTQVYDGRPINAARLLADGLYGYLTAPSLRWFRVVMHDRELGDHRAVRMYLGELEEHFYHIFRHTFYAAIHSLFEICSNLGTGTMYSEEDEKLTRQRFDTFDIQEIYIAQNINHVVDTTHRKFEISYREAAKEFKDKANLLVDGFDVKVKDSPEETTEILHIVMPNEDWKPHGMMSKDKEFYSCYIGVDKSVMLREGGYDENPYFTWRWRRRGNKGAYGLGPGHFAMVDIKTLNQMSKTNLQAGNKIADPAYNVPEEMETVKIAPRGINRYRETGRIVVPLHAPTGIPITLEMADKVAKIIEQHFHVEFFLLLSQMDQARKTATEVVEMAGEKATVMGAIVHNLMDEVFNPLFDRVFKVEGRAGRLPKPPDILYDREIEIDYMGPLAQAQKKWLESQGITQGLATVVPLMEIYPEVKDVIDPDKAIKSTLRGVGFPEEAIRSDDEIKKLRKARQEIVQQQQTMDNIERMGKVVPLEKAPEQGSPVQQLVGS